MDEVTMTGIAEMMGRWYAISDLTFSKDVQPLIQRYADQAAENARMEAQLVIDHLNEQLGRALVPKFKVGDRVTWGKHEVTIALVETSYTLYKLKVNSGNSFDTVYRIPEDSLSPLPDKCPVNHQVISGQNVVVQVDNYSDFVTGAHFCLYCGESLTASTKESE